jgi:hypothetical protein
MRARALPAVVLVAACGRLEFEPFVGDARGAIDARGARDATVDVAAAAISWVGPFAERHPGVLQTDTFTAQATATGDAIVLLVACYSGTEPSSVSVTAPGWSFAPISALVGANSLWIQTLGAIAPDTTAVTVTVTWPLTCNGTGEFGDELANADPAGGAVTFDAHAESTGTGDCTLAITTRDDDAAVWAGCFTLTALTAPGPGFTKTADDQGGDWAELDVTTSPAGTQVPVAYQNDPAATYTFGAVTIKPR